MDDLTSRTGKASPSAKREKKATYWRRILAMIRRIAVRTSDWDDESIWELVNDLVRHWRDFGSAGRDNVGMLS